MGIALRNATDKSGCLSESRIRSRIDQGCIKIVAANLFPHEVTNKRCFEIFLRSNGEEGDEFLKGSPSTQTPHYCL